jgi:ribosome recycling factor
VTTKPSKLDDRLKQIIAYVALGASLVAYGDSRFASKEQVKENTKKLETTATKDDIHRLENKIDKLTDHLLKLKQ